VLHVQTSGTFAAAAGILGILLSLALAPAHGQSAVDHPWLDPELLMAAQAEGSLTIYSSMNEQEGLPLWKIFEDATGIKVNYIRGADGALMGRIAMEYRGGGQNTWDILHTTTLNKVPPELLASFDPSEAKNILPEARDPGRRWYGVMPITIRRASTRSTSSRPSCRRAMRNSPRTRNGREGSRSTAATTNG
jgi:hypothetical protein